MNGFKHSALLRLFLRVRHGLGISLVTVGLGCIVWQIAGIERADAGATVTSFQNASREEITAQLDTIVQDNIMTVCVSPSATIRDDGSLGIYLENDESNPFAQKYSIVQDGVEIYRSGALSPGEVIRSCNAPQAKPGQATVTIQALDSQTLSNHGSPTNVRISIVAT